MFNYWGLLDIEVFDMGVFLNVMWERYKRIVKLLIENLGDWNYGLVYNEIVNLYISMYDDIWLEY